ncbi:hypothetical protein [Sphaerisporangium aureirubrum]|uniref:Sensor histidine kinase n=1 Tax=Sphaerisporangium aureirubrum TaxID=1544736 RepID=A0ABW1NX17_9ACTN
MLLLILVGLGITAYLVWGNRRPSNRLELLYRDLLAHTDDAMGMQGLIQHAASVENVLAQSVREAIATGQALAMPDTR